MTTTNTATGTKMMDILTATAEHNYPNWNPVTHPYRVLATLRQSNAHLAAVQVTGVFATEDEARVAFAAVGPKALIRVQVDLARNADRWIDAGRWERVASRRAGQR